MWKHENEDNIDVITGNMVGWDYDGDPEFLIDFLESAIELGIVAPVKVEGSDARNVE